MCCHGDDNFLYNYFRLTEREIKDTEYKETVYTLAREHEKVTKIMNECCMVDE